MFNLVLLLLLMFLVLAALMVAWSMWVQAYLYTEIAPGMLWRGPAAAGGIMVVVLLWVIVSYKSPGNYRPLWEFSSGGETKPFPELRVSGTRGEEVYKLRPGARVEYRKDGLPSGTVLPSRPREIIVIEDGQRSVFKPDLDEKGKFKQETTRSMGRESKEPLHYRDEMGRVMLEGSLGQLSTFKGGVFVGNLVLNLLFFVVCFVVIWLVLRFQWLHALGQAAILWLAILLFVLPPVLTRAEKVAQERAQRAA